MADHEHPIDEVVMDFCALRNEMAAEFLADDGVISDRESGILVRFDEGRRRIGRARAFERATSLAMKQEGDFTKYTERQFALAGVKIEPLDAA